MSGMRGRTNMRAVKAEKSNGYEGLKLVDLPNLGAAAG
jgi:hypothetical protein